MIFRMDQILTGVRSTFKVSALGYLVRIYELEYVVSVLRSYLVFCASSCFVFWFTILWIDSKISSKLLDIFVLFFSAFNLLSLIRLFIISRSVMVLFSLPIICCVDAIRHNH